MHVGLNLVFLVPGLPSALGTVVAAIVYLGLLFALRAVPAEVVHAIPRPARMR